MRSGLITHPEKVLFPERGETKADLARHYLRIAEPLMRTMGGRPVLLQRFPEGAAGPSFFQKRVPGNIPDWLQTATVSTPNGTTSQALVAADLDHVLWAVNLGCRAGMSSRPGSAPAPERDDNALEVPLGYQRETVLQHQALVPEQRRRQLRRRRPAEHPDPLAGEHQRERDIERLVAAPERACLQRRHGHREVADVLEVARVAQPGLPVERVEEEHPVAGPRVGCQVASGSAEVEQAAARSADPLLRPELQQQRAHAQDRARH